MKIALVRPKYDSHLITPPLSLGYLSSYLKINGHETKIIDGLNKDYSNNEIVKRCHGYDLIGISCLSDYFLETIDLCKKLKQKGLKTVIGGPQATTLPFLTMEKTNTDYVVVGEGEKTILDLANALENKKDTRKILGLVSKGQKKFKERPFIEDLDDLPFPDWEQMNPKEYKKAPHGALIKNFPVAPITSSRGCPYDCKFCASPEIWHRKIRFRSPENVIEEIKYLINNFGVKEIHFEDDNLTLIKNHIISICNLILKEKIKISWACPNGVRADSLDEDIIRLMKKSGCYYLAFGIESGNQEILDNINKRTNLKIIEKVIRLAEKEGIMTQGFFIFGLPGETKETIKNTINFAKRVPLSRAQFLLLDILPGSKLWSELNYSDKVNWGKSSYHETTWIPQTIDRETLNNSPAKAFKSFFFRPKQIFSLIRYFRLSQMPFILKRLLDFKIIKPKN